MVKYERRSTVRPTFAHEMIDVDISDPDGDFEIMSERPISSNLKVSQGRDTEIIDTLMKMYDQGLLTDDQLLDMVEKVENGEEIEAVKELTTIRAQTSRPTYQPPTFATLPSVRPSAMATIGDFTCSINLYL